MIKAALLGYTQAKTFGGGFFEVVLVSETKIKNPKKTTQLSDSVLALVWRKQPSENRRNNPQLECVSFNFARLSVVLPPRSERTHFSLS